MLPPIRILISQTLLSLPPELHPRCPEDVQLVFSIHPFSLQQRDNLVNNLISWDVSRHDGSPYTSLASCISPLKDCGIQVSIFAHLVKRVQSSDASADLCEMASCSGVSLGAAESLAIDAALTCVASETGGNLRINPRDCPCTAPRTTFKSEVGFT